VSPERSIAALVLVLAGYLVFAGLGARSLENRDITRTAEIARETLEQGRWLAPTREGELEIEKPPLYIWLTAGLGKVTGKVGALESRLPAAAASYLSVLLVFFWLLPKRGTTVAAVAAAFLAVGQVFLELARISRVDSVFAFLLAVSVLASYEAEKKPLGRNLYLSAVSGVALAGAMLAKSPLLALVLHLASVGGFYIADLAVERPWQRLREPAPLTILRRFLAPAASLPPILACGLFAVWFVPFRASLTPAEWTAVWNQFLYENTDRAVSGSDKPQPFWFYVPGVLFRAAPGSIFALLFWRQDDKTRPLARFAQSWWFFPFLVLSIASGKQGRYILPCLPGLAVAGALGWERFAASEDPRVRGTERLLAVILAGAGGLAALALPIASAVALPEVLGDACWLALVCAVVSFLALVAAKQRGLLAPLLLAVFVGEAAWNVVLLPSSSIERPRAVVKTLAAELPADLKLEDLVVFQIPKQGNEGETRQRRLRILLSLYRDDRALPLVATTPEQLLEELGRSPRRRALVDAANWPGLAAISSELAVEHEWPLSADRPDERFRLVRRAR
jgi:4-amino-4-deoxy-L-arabinose transferase-like glycosyltransferase